MSDVGAGMVQVYCKLWKYSEATGYQPCFVPGCGGARPEHELACGACRHVLKQRGDYQMCQEWFKDEAAALNAHDRESWDAWVDAGEAGGGCKKRKKARAGEAATEAQEAATEAPEAAKEAQEAATEPPEAAKELEESTSALPLRCEDEAESGASQTADDSTKAALAVTVEILGPALRHYNVIRTGGKNPPRFMAKALREAADAMPPSKARPARASTAAAS